MVAATSLSGKTDPLAEDRHVSKSSSVRVVAPLFLLGSPRSFTSVVCAMLGQQPQMYGFPETRLFVAETLAGTWNKRPKQYPEHGLRRVVAQLFFGEQTDATIKLARRWLRRRSHFNTGFIFELLAERVYPLIPVEKSPDVVNNIRSLERMYKFFPHARFIHLLRHPRGHGESI
jgi:sulfotransferase family protein